MTSSAVPSFQSILVTLLLSVIKYADRGNFKEKVLALAYSLKGNIVPQHVIVGNVYGTP